MTATNTFPYRHFGGGARGCRATRPTGQAQRGVSVPAALGGGGGAPSPWRAWPPWPGPRPAPVAWERRAPARPPAASPCPRPPQRCCLAVRGVLQKGGCSGSPLPGESRISARRGGRAPAGPGGGSPRSASPGSCLGSPRPLGLLPLSPAPPPRAGIREPPGPGASPLALPSQRLSASLRRSRVPCLPGDPPRTPETARAQSAGARSARRLGPRGAAGQPAGLGRDAGCAVSPGAKAMSGARCRTLYPFSGERHSQGLRFTAGELITLLQVPDGGWWEGEKEDGLRGWFPASYVQLLEGAAKAAGASGGEGSTGSPGALPSRRASRAHRGRSEEARTCCLRVLDWRVRCGQWQGPARV
uniref:Uncharacterized protein LOC109678321 n=1 Tax=Castor canadensis TaxID=51338 RepID=A0A8B7TPN5_CASCN|nr:uncharacterized protein LOC109678321 [Castor canadensis]